MLNNKLNYRLRVIVIICIIAVLCSMSLLMQSCSGSGDNSPAGIEQTVGDMTVKNEKVFGEKNNAYILATVNVPKGISFKGRISDIILSVDGAGGYSFACIGEDEATRTQTYIISITADPDVNLNKKNATLKFIGYNSTEGTMESLAKGELEFSVKLDLDNNYIDVPMSDDSAIPAEYVRIYPGAVVIGTITGTDVKTAFSDIKIINTDGDTVDLEINSRQATGNNMTEVFCLFDKKTDISKISKITVGDVVLNTTDK